MIGARAQVALYFVSALLHGGLAAAISTVESPKAIETVRITMREAPVVPTPKPIPPHESAAPPMPEAPAQAASPTREPRRSRRPERTEAPVPEAAPSAPPDFGVAMQGGSHLGGLAVPEGTPSGTPSSEVVRRSSRTLVSDSAASDRGESDCEEEATRPRVLSLQQPAYTEDARSLGIEGRVRLRIAVEEDGTVHEVAVLEGLGHGLDEAAVASARAARFEPATRCGTATRSTFNLRITFSL